MKLACGIALITAWIALAAWLGAITANQPESIPSDFGFRDDPPAAYEGRMEPDCTVNLHLLKK